MKSKKSWNYTEAGRIVHILPRNNSGPVPAKGAKQTDPWPIFFNVEELQRSFFSFSRKKGLLAVSSEANSRTGTQKGNRKKRHTFWHVLRTFFFFARVAPLTLHRSKRGLFQKVMISHRCDMNRPYTDGWKAQSKTAKRGTRKQTKHPLFLSRISFFGGFAFFQEKKGLFQFLVRQMAKTERKRGPNHYVTRLTGHRF